MDAASLPKASHGDLLKGATHAHKDTPRHTALMEACSHTRSHKCRIALLAQLETKRRERPFVWSSKGFIPRRDPGTQDHEHRGVQAFIRGRNKGRAEHWNQSTEGQGAERTWGD